MYSNIYSTKGIRIRVPLKFVRASTMYTFPTMCTYGKVFTSAHAPYTLYTTLLAPLQTVSSGEVKTRCFLRKPGNNFLTTSPLMFLQKASTL